MDSLRSIIPRVLHKRGLMEQASAAHCAFRAREWLKEKLPAFADVIHVTSLKDGILQLTTDHSIAAQECQQVLPDLISFLKEEGGIYAPREARLQRS